MSKRYNGESHCEPMCGQLPLLPEGQQTFRERLSPQCGAVMDDARAFGTPRTGIFPPGRCALWQQLLFGLQNKFHLYQG